MNEKVNGESHNSKDSWAIRKTDLKKKKRVPLHRLGEVRRRKGISQSQVARRLGISVNQVERQERESTNVRLSVLHEWQKVLDVPMRELLVEPNEQALRDSLTRVMETVLELAQQGHRTPVETLARGMVGQLLEIMPELRDVRPRQEGRCAYPVDDYGRRIKPVSAEEMFAEHEK